MDFTHQTNRSEWDDAYTNVQVTSKDVQFAIVTVCIFALFALTF